MIQVTQFMIHTLDSGVQNSIQKNTHINSDRSKSNKNYLQALDPLKKTHRMGGYFVHILKENNNNKQKSIKTHSCHFRGQLTLVGAMELSALVTHTENYGKDQILSPNQIKPMESQKHDEPISITSMNPSFNSLKQGFTNK